ncbi:MAG: hypothetical protein GY859_38485, partial [Desulfobacterales bacterium]|nr:hypothetical protein [Desulfobacterales bacterium]
VLDGISIPRGRHSQLKAAIESELSRLLAGGGLTSRLTENVAAAHVSGGTIHAGTHNDATTLGRRIARAVHGGLNR